MLETSREQLLTAVGGRLARAGDARSIGGVSTDTRTIASGDLYVPLRGERFDGHRFIEKAMAQGAAGFLFAEDADLDVDALLAGTDGFAIAVPDTLRALGDLAHDLVRRSGAPVIAITGSTGKTSTKDMIVTILAAHAPVCHTVGNFNNLIGLPLSVFRCAPHDRYLVLEMGMSELGEIARLAEIAPPSVGVITNVGAAHLEQLRDLDTVARAKGELYDALCPKAVAVANSADPRVLAAYAAGCKAARRTFGERADDDVRIGEIEVTADGAPRATLHVRGEALELELAVLGAHNVWNAAAAIAATLDFVPPADAVEALRSHRGPRNRMERFVRDGVVVISDCYNANPRSMSAALETVAAVPRATRRVAVLGDMLELGEASEQAHVELGQEAARLRFDRLYAVGQFASHVRRGAELAGLPADRVATAEDVLELAPPLRDALTEGDWVLLKGSRGLRMERLLGALDMSPPENRPV